MKKAKKRNLRNQTQYPALKKSVNLRLRQDYIDYDYVDKLSEEEKDWLNRFTEEFVNANFHHEGERIHPQTIIEKTVKSTGKKKEVDLEKQESEGRNNSRNRCVYNRAKASGRLGKFDK